MKHKIYKRRKGLEGPFVYPNGRVLYRDRKTNEYWDPRTDFYVDASEVEELQTLIFDSMRGYYAGSN